MMMMMMKEEALDYTVENSALEGAVDFPQNRGCN
jgi:hypothetical protein